MSARACDRSDGLRRQLTECWQVCSTPPSQFADPVALAAGHASPPQWFGPVRLAPVAAVLRMLGQLDAELTPPLRIDAQDWWYRLAFDVPDHDPAEGAQLGLDGLATVAEVWLNGQAILSSRNMFAAWAADVRHLLRAQGNELVMVFRAMDEVLAQKRPRPRWRTPMVEHQALRWIRTSLTGRMPSWTPPVPPVGPWRGIWLAHGAPIKLDALRLTPALVDEQGLQRGVLSIACEAKANRGALGKLVLRLARAGGVDEVVLERDEVKGRYVGSLTIKQPDLWWPHTHGEPALYRASLQAHLTGCDSPVDLELGDIGFRSVHVEQQGGGFSVVINGVPVFCRGANWLPLDAANLHADEAAYERALQQVRAAGMNMLRLPGSMVYESDQFFDACDRLGILVWQDFMFSNMDYPGDDADFVAQVEQEARQQLQRLQARPSLAVLCGNSEVEQQALMWAASRDRWQPALFHVTLPALVAECCPQVPYWPSSAHGGAFPCQGDQGTTSYYGVGVYLRPMEDARRANLRFATECLGFANEPERPGMRRIPDDVAIGGNFELVRDHYLALLFEVDTEALKAADPARYFHLSRVTSGEVMAAAFNEWRRPGSTCRGALVWFLRDLWAGAGFGLIDHLGEPKSCYHYLKRVLQPVALSISDEGCNGLYLHVVNEHAQVLAATIEVDLYRPDGMSVGNAQRELEVAPRGGFTLPMMAMFDWFIDASNAYRFGEPAAQVIVARLRSAQGALLAQAYAFPGGMALPEDAALGLRALAQPLGDGAYALQISAERFAQAVRVHVDGYVPDDNYFHLAPGEQRAISLRPIEPGIRPFAGTVRALNGDTDVAITLEGGQA